MQYLGGKSRIAKRIAAHLEALASQGALIEDRFCGGLSVAAAIRHRPLRVADANAALVCTLRAVQGGWVPPTTLTEDEYATLKAKRDPADPMTAFAAIGCSFGGKWFRGFARSTGRNHADEAARGLRKKLSVLSDVEIACEDYREREPRTGDVVYLDPPYKTDERFYTNLPKFDHSEFWSLATCWARLGVHVRVSEYEAPSDWVVVEDFGSVSQLGRSMGAQRVRIDRLWKHVDGR